MSGVGFEASIFTAALKKWLGKAAKVVETWVFGGGYFFLALFVWKVEVGEIKVHVLIQKDVESLH